MAAFTETLRRVYHDLVVRRSRIHISRPKQVKLEYPPIFIIGAYRSGTTLLRYVIDSHSHICCPPESYFMTALSPLVNDDRCRGGLESMGFDAEHTIQKTREFCLYFFGNCAAAHGKPRWADKTPGYIDCLEFLLRLFPEGQFIIMYRHGLDQAHSYTRGGTFMRESLRDYCQDQDRDIRIGAARYWSEKTRKLMDFAQHHPEKCIQIFYEKLCEAPDEQLRRLFDFVSEPWQPEVLEFCKFPHDIGREDGRALATRGFFVSEGHYLGWSAELVKECMNIVGPTMKYLGYGVEEIDC